MCGERLIKHALARIVKALGLPGVYSRRRHVTDAGVAMVVVVPGEEPLAERTSMFMKPKRARKSGWYLRGLELLRNGVYDLDV